MKHFLTFSEAIREGAKLRPQGSVEMFRNGKTCAIGAGLEAMGHRERGIRGRKNGNYQLAVNPYPYLLYKTSCPVTNCDYLPGSDELQAITIITHLNDYHEWSREAIADWLETEEEKLGYVTITIDESEVLREPTPTLETVTVR